MKSYYPVQSYISYSLAVAHRKIHASLTRRLKAYGVQVEAWRVLEVLEDDTALTMGGLADLVVMNPPTLTKLVDRMVADGLVHRRVASRDHRQINLGLTALGKKRIQQIREQAILEEKELSDKIGQENVEKLRMLLSELSS